MFHNVFALPIPLLLLIILILPPTTSFLLPHTPLILTFSRFNSRPNSRPNSLSMAKAYGPLPPFSPISPENTPYLDSDVFANFTTWESSQSDLVSERGRLFSELMSSMRLLVEESGETTIDVTSELGVSLLQVSDCPLPSSSRRGFSAFFFSNVP